MRAIYDNLVDYSGVTITAGTANADLPASNVIHPFLTKVYRTGVSAAAEWIKFDLGAPKAAQSIAVLAHTLTASDSLIKIQANATDVWTSPSVDQAMTFNATKMIYWFAAEQTYQWWRFIFTKSAAGETRDIGRIFIGPYLELEKAPAQGDGIEIEPRDLSVTRETPGGQSYSSARDIQEDVNIGFPLFTEAGTTSFLTYARAVGTHTPHIISIDPTNKAYDWLYYVKFRSLKRRKVEFWSTAKKYYSLSAEYREQL